MKTGFLLAMVLFLGRAFGQSDDAAKYAAFITGTDLQKHLTIIAGDAMEGRETGTEGQRKAAAYIESQFKLLGLKTAKGLDGYQQFYPLYQDSMISCELKINGAPLEFGKDYISPVNNNETGNFNSSEMVFVGYGIEDKNYNDYAALNVSGKTVVFFSGEPKADGIYLVSGTKKASDWSAFQSLPMKLALAAKKGAAGVLMINPTQESFNQRAADNSKRTGVVFPRGGAEKKANFAVISHAMAARILAANADSLISRARTGRNFSSTDYVSTPLVVAFSFTRYRNTINASNVIGIMEGTDKKDEYVFLTGHYDHLGKHDGKIYYGADDDGSGTCNVIEMAGAFAKAKAAGKGPRRTIVFMTVSGEEKGLWGSEYYSDHPLYPLDKTTVDLNTDMIGRVDTERKTADTLNYVYVVGHDKISSDLPVINEEVNKKYTGLKLDYKFDDPNDNERIYYRSDHYNFARKGVPVLFFYDGMLKADYHKPTDTVDKINWSLYEKRARMIFHTAWVIANRENMLVRDKPLTEGTR